MDENERRLLKYTIEGLEAFARSLTYLSQACQCAANVACVLADCVQYGMAEEAEHA